MSQRVVLAGVLAVVAVVIAAVVIRQGWERTPGPNPQATPLATASRSASLPETGDGEGSRSHDHTGGAGTVEEEIDWRALTDEQWRARLSDEAYYVTRRHGTERARTGAYWDNKAPGTYRCVGCNLELFSSQTKYESGTGWPSFWQPVRRESVGESVDDTLFSRRTEVHCNRCGAHLGHVFPDGPPPTNLRYCINSAALTFEPAPSKADAQGPDSPPDDAVHTGPSKAGPHGADAADGPGAAGVEAAETAASTEGE